MNVLVYYLVVGAVGVAARLWLERALRDVATPDRVRPLYELPAPLPSFQEQLELEAERLASELQLEHDAAAGARRLAGRGVVIDYRVGGSFASRVHIARSAAALPSFALLPHPDVNPTLPRAVRRRVKELLARRRSAPVELPFVGWAPPAEVRSEPLRLAARRAAAEVELLEHEEGVFTAWIVSWSPEQAAEQVRRILRFTDTRLSSSAPYR